MVNRSYLLFINFSFLGLIITGELFMFFEDKRN